MFNVVLSLFVCFAETQWKRSISTRSSGAYPSRALRGRNLKACHLEQGPSSVGPSAESAEPREMRLLPGLEPLLFRVAGRVRWQLEQVSDWRWLGQESVKCRWPGYLRAECLTSRVFGYLVQVQLNLLPKWFLWLFFMARVGKPGGTMIAREYAILCGKITQNLAGCLAGWLPAFQLTLPYLTLPAYQASRIFPNHSCILWQHDVRDLLMQIQSTSRSLCSLVLNQFNPVYTFISMYD